MDHTTIIDAYLAGIEALRAAVAGLDAARLRARPDAGGWSILEVVCHLADSETLFAERMKRVLCEDRPTLPFVDPARHASVLAYDARDVAEELALIEAVRRQTARMLRAQPADAWRRVGMHCREGERTLEQLLQKAVDHLKHHLAFVIAKRRLLSPVSG